MQASTMGGTRKRRVALVIGAGSVKCVAALGLANVLREENIGYDMLVGCSAGALFAAVLATGVDIEHATQMTRTLWTREITKQPDRRALLSALLPRLFKFDAARFGLKDDRLILARMREAFGDMNIEDLPVPLHIAATDFNTGEQVVMSKGNLVDAIRASIAIPFVFRPSRVDGRLCTDGFLSDPLPVGVAMKEGADLIIAMGFDNPAQTRMNSAVRFAFQYSTVMTNNLLRSRFAFHNLAHHAEIVPVIPEFGQRIGLFDTAKIPYIIEEGERTAREQLPHLRSLLEMESRVGQTA